MNVWVLMRYNSVGTFAGVHSVYVDIPSAIRSVDGKWTCNEVGVWLCNTGAHKYALQPYKLEGDYPDAERQCALAALRDDPMALDAIKDVLRC